MKRTVFTLLLFLAIMGVYGQSGIEAGAVIQPHIYSQYYTTPLEGRAIKIPYGFAIGIDAGYNFTDNFGFRTGFVYSPQGDRYAITTTDPEEAFDLNLEYLQVPFSLKINGSTSNTISPILLAGPYVGFLNNATKALNGGDPISVLGEYKRIIYGGAIALGIQLNLDDGGNLNFLWRTSGSLIPVQKDPDPEAYNIVTGLQVSYHYYLGL